LKFAGRKQPRFFPRLLKRSSVLGTAPSFAATSLALGLAALCGVGWLAVALLGAVLDVSASLPFTFAAGHAVADAGIGWWIAAALLVLGIVWLYPARQWRRQPFDALFFALLAFELFTLIRWQGLLSPPRAVPEWQALSAIEKCTLALAVSLLLSLLAAWMLRPKHGKTYQMSAPTRVTGFLKKRRRRMLFIGGAFMAVAVGGVIAATQLAFDGSIPGLYRGGEYEIVLAPTLAMLVFVVCDAIYLLGRHYWYRLT